MFWLDSILILSILFGVAYAWRASAIMQNVKSEIKPVTRQLGSYLNTISQHIQQLRETTEVNRHTLSSQLPQAQALRDDFEVVLDHGQRLAARLDSLLEQVYSVEKDLRNVNQNIAQGSKPRVRHDATTHEPIRHTTHQTHHKDASTTIASHAHPEYAPTRPAEVGTRAANAEQRTTTQYQRAPLSPGESVDKARMHAMQTRNDILHRLRGVRI